MTPVVREDYKRALAAARKDYEALVQERKTIDARLLETRDVILSLSKLCEGEAEQVVLPSTAGEVFMEKIEDKTTYRWIGVGETIKNFSDLALEEEQKRRK